MKWIKEQKRYIITAAAGLAAAVVIAIGRNLFGETGDSEKLLVISDAFFLPGMLFICIGILILCANAGTFDGLGYALKSLRDVMSRERMEHREDFYMYRTRMAEKKTKCGHFLLVGGGMSILSAVLALLYYI